MESSFENIFLETFTFLMRRRRGERQRETLTFLFYWCNLIVTILNFIVMTQFMAILLELLIWDQLLNQLHKFLFLLIKKKKHNKILGKVYDTPFTKWCIFTSIKYMIQNYLKLFMINYILEDKYKKKYKLLILIM